MLEVATSSTVMLTKVSIHAGLSGTQTVPLGEVTGDYTLPWMLTYVSMTEGK